MKKRRADSSPSCDFSCQIGITERVKDPNRTPGGYNGPEVTVEPSKDATPLGHSHKRKVEDSLTSTDPSRGHRPSLRVRTEFFQPNYRILDTDEDEAEAPPTTDATASTSERPASSGTSSNIARAGERILKSTFLEYFATLSGF
ncbi:hypothetical protein U1Q18_051920 [Sarracenia purpurea var. burkii]